MLCIVIRASYHVQRQDSLRYYDVISICIWARDVPSPVAFGGDVKSYQEKKRPAVDPQDPTACSSSPKTLPSILPP
jgi:hypothetical protein